MMRATKPWRDLGSQCGGRNKVIAVIKDGLTAKKILDHLGLGDAQAANNQPTGPPQLDLPLAA